MRQHASLNLPYQQTHLILFKIFFIECPGKQTSASLYRKQAGADASI